MAFNKKELDQSFKLFSINGFSFKKEIMGYSWTKEFPDRKESIIIGYRGYPDSYVVYTPTVNIYFPEVENILEEYGLGEEYKSTFGKSFQDLKDVDYEKLSIEINSTESFNIVKTVVQDIIEKGVLPFINRFCSLKEIADFLADKKFEEIVPYIQGAILLPKTVLIMKLADHPYFTKRLLEFRSVLLEYAQTNDKYNILLNKFNTLFSEDLKAV
jgi:hypothetical protein